MRRRLAKWRVFVQNNFDADRRSSAQEKRAVPRKRPDAGDAPAAGPETAEDRERHGACDSVRDVRGRSPDVRRVRSMRGRLLQGAEVRCERASRKAAAGAGAFHNRDFRRLSPELDANPRVDANGGAKRRDLVRDFLQHAVSRILPSPGLPSFRVWGFVAHARVLSAHGGAVSPFARHADQAIGVGASSSTAMADRLAANESKPTEGLKPACGATRAVCRA
jgi:hypothetical protein